MSYLGFNVGPLLALAPATGPATPFVAAAALITSALPALASIGAGRKEADVIVPKQNELAAALTQLDTIIRTEPLSASDLTQLIQQLQLLWQQFMQFLYQPVFTQDGDTRASDGARDTMQPQVQMRLATLQQMLSALQGVPSVPQAVQGNGSGIQSLQFRTTSASIPQAGFIQPGSLPPAPAPGTISLAGTPIDTGLLTKMALAAGVVYLVSQMGK